MGPYRIKTKGTYKKYVDLEKVDISFSLNEGLKFSNTKTEFLEGTLSLMDSTLSFKTKYQNMTKNRLSKFEDAADITIGRQDASSVEAHIKNVVGDKDFKMPMKKYFRKYKASGEYDPGSFVMIEFITKKLPSFDSSFTPARQKNQSIKYFSSAFGFIDLIFLWFSHPKSCSWQMHDLQ